VGAVHRNTIAVLLVSLAIAVAWPIAAYILYPTPSEDVEVVASVSDVSLAEGPPSFMVGVGGMLTFRGSGFEVRGVVVFTREKVAVVKLESGEVVAVVFMPRYRCAGVDREVAGFELSKLINGKSVVFKGHVFLTRRGWVLVPTEVTASGMMCAAVPRHR
jgi:hypothetical protein